MMINSKKVKRFGILAGLIAVLSLTILPACTSPAALKNNLPKVVIKGKTFTAEVANTSAARYRGLSGRSDIPASQAMIFIYPTPRVLDFCMRGCRNPIDILFVDANLKVVSVYNMQPELELIKKPGDDDLKDWKVYSSKTEVIYAIEIRGGLAEKLGVVSGDFVELINVPAAVLAQED